MSLIVEDGTGVTGANSYVSVADHVTYAANYGITLTTQQAEINLRKFMDYIESLEGFKGCKTVNTQQLRFPRKDLWIEELEIDQNTIPWQLIKAQNEGALLIQQGVDKLAVRERPIKTEAFGPFSTTYMDNREVVETSARTTLYLQPLLKYESNGLQFRVESDKSRHIHNDCCDNDYPFGPGGYWYYS